MKEAVVVSPAEIERRFDDIITAAMDRGWDGSVRRDLEELRALVHDLCEVVNNNAQVVLDLCARVAEIEHVTYEGTAREPIERYRQRHMDREPLRVIRSDA
jgi:hypothetical protein